MSNPDWSSRENKAIVRSALIADLPHKGLRRSLWLPSNKALCVNEAYSMQKLHDSAELIFIERDPEIMRQTREATRSIRASKRVREWNAELTEFDELEGLDYVYLDLMGHLDRDLCLWLRKLVKASPQTSIDLAVIYNWRANQMLGDLKEKLKAEILEMCERIGYHDTYVALPLVVLNMVFADFCFDVLPPINYRDSIQGMLVFRLRNFSPAPKRGPLLEEYLMTNFSERARKAWVTRREKQKLESTRVKRAEAANKAWSTRRKKAAPAATPEPQSKGTLAALKAWATRRANGWVHPSKRSP